MGAIRELMEVFEPPSRLEDVEREMERLRDRLEALGEEAWSDGKRRYGKARKRVPAEARHLRRELARVERAAGSTVSDRPFQSVLAAFGLGVLIAVLIGYGSRRDG